MTPYFSAFWSVTPAELLRQLQTTTQGMTNEDAQERLARYGANVLKIRKRTDTLDENITEPGRYEMACVPA